MCAPAGETVPSKIICLSIYELGTRSGEGEGRGPDILSASVRCTDKESREKTCEEGGELHGGEGVRASELIFLVFITGRDPLTRARRSRFS